MPYQFKTNQTARLPGDLALPTVENRNNRPRHESGKMNKLEAAYAWELELRKRAGDILAFWFEPFKLRLAKRTYYSVDFLVQYSGGLLECVEVKGRLEDDAAAKFKIAREMYPCFRWTMLTKRNGTFVEMLK